MHTHTHTHTRTLTHTHARTHTHTHTHTRTHAHTLKKWVYSVNLENGTNCKYTCTQARMEWIAVIALIVGSHDRRSLQLFPKMYYYASPTLSSETTLPLKNPTERMLKTTTPCNRWKIFLSIPYPHVITFCLVWQHHDVFQTSATASKSLRIEPKSCILMQLFEATCVRNLLIVKNPEHEKFHE